MANSMHVTLKKISAVGFEIVNPSGNAVTIDGPPDMGGLNTGMRPMEVVLAGLASCSAVDVIHIMQKQRQPLEDLTVEVEGERADTVPAVFTHIHLRFVGSGKITLDKLGNAVKLSMEKYCSVAKMLEPTVRITHESVVTAH